MRVAIIIPALNEAGNIRRLVHEIPRDVAASVEVIVVDNGSTDGTADEARAAGARVVSESRQGYGYACAAGIETVEAADVIVFLDGDGSFDPMDLPCLLAPISEKRADMVLGTRMAAQIETGAMPPHQLFGNRLMSRLMRWLYGLHVTDLGPYRAVRLSLLRSLDMREMTFGWPTEMMVKAVRRNAHIVEVPVRYRKRWSGKSKVSGTLRGTVLAAYYIFGTVLRYAFASRE
jgi:glycosyltransferase involved in cell wall biosynthesis